jgi:hypothetical protein
MKVASAAQVCVFAIACAFAGNAYCEAPPSGFSGSVSAQAYSNGLDVLFLGETNGYLCAYSATEGRIAARCRVTPYPIVLIACHPDNGEISLVASDGSSRHTAVFLHYDDGEFHEFKREELGEKPESLAYSPKGGLLAITALTARGIILKDTIDYSTIDGFTRDCGPASFIAIGSSEKSLLQYAPQGRIIYRSLPRGTIIQETRTLANLDRLSLSDDKKSLFAVNQGDFVSIDSQSGKLLFSIPKKTLSCYSMPDSSGVSVFGLDNGEYQELDISARKVPSAYYSAPGAFVSMLRHGSLLSALDRKGTVYISSRIGELTPLLSDPFLSVQFVQPFMDGDDQGFLFCGKGFLSFVSDKDLFSGDPGSAISAKPVGLSISGITAFTSFSASFYAATTSAAKSELLSLSGLSGDSLRIPLDSASQVNRINSGAYGVLVLQANGALSSINSGTAKRLISINGIQDAAVISPGRIAIGKARGGSLAAPLLFYSMAKGEIAPAPLEAIAVLRIIPTVQDSFYALCIENGEKGVMTSIREIAYAPFSNGLIMSVPGERFGLQLTASESGSVYYAFDDEPILYRFTKGQEREESPLDDLAVSLCVGQSGVCALHADGSFSAIGFADKKTSRFAMGTGSRIYRLER